MGQYYKPANLDKKEWLYSHDYDSGLKLMEHSWMENPFVLAVERLLIPGGAWYKTRLVWGGDYSERKELVPLDINKKFGKWYPEMYPKNAAKYPDKSIPNVYNVCLDDMETGENGIELPAPEWRFRNVRPEPLTDEESARYKYIVNHTKMMFIDKFKTPKDKDGWRVHPLPLITADSNGDGGSYHSDNGIRHFGMWAGDVISLEERLPTDQFYVELKPDFKE